MQKFVNYMTFLGSQPVKKNGLNIVDLLSRNYQTFSFGLKRMETMPRATFFRTRKNKDNPFVMMDKRPIENPKLSWKAKGILAYLLSRPDNWEIWIEDLIRRSTDGAASVRVGLKELQDAGHLFYAGRAREKGQVKKAIWEVYEVPEPGTENRNQAPDNENPNYENRTHTNNDSNNTESNNISTRTRKSKPKPLSSEQMNEIIKDSNRLVDGILATERQAVEQETYPNRTEFPEGFQRDFADLYAKHTGQQPRTKNQTNFWKMAFSQWNDAGYTVKVLDIALRYAKSQNLTITVPLSLAKDGGGLMAFVDGELRKGNTFSELFEETAKEDVYWRTV